MLMSRIDVERVDDECEMVLDSIQHFFQLVSFALSELPRESNRNQLHDRVVLALRQLISSIGQNLLSDQLLRHIKCLWEHFLNHQVVRNTCRFQSSLFRLLDAADKCDKFRLSLDLSKETPTFIYFH